MQTADFTIADPWQPGVQIRWARSLDRRPLAVTDLDHVTIASHAAPLSVTLQEVAGVFPIGWFDLIDAPPSNATWANKDLGVAYDLIDGVMLQYHPDDDVHVMLKIARDNIEDADCEIEQVQS